MRKIRYKFKLILCYILFVSFPLILCFFLLYQSLVEPVSKNTLNSIHQRMNQEITTVQSKLEKIHNTSYLLSTNTVINQFLIPTYYEDLELVSMINNEISPLLSWLEAANPEISYYHFFTDNPYIPKSKFFHQYSEHSAENWMKQMEASIFETGFYMEACHPIRNYSYGHASKNQYVYSLFYPLLSDKNYLEICIKPDIFFKDLNAVPVLNSGLLAAVDANGLVVSKQLPTALKEELEFFFQEGDFLVKDNMLFNKTLAGTQYFIASQKCEPLDTFIVCIIPSKEIAGPVAAAQQSFLLVILISLLGVALLSYILATLLIRRINKMIDAVHKIQHGDFHISLPVYGNDEIDQLASDINYMSYTINELINQVYKSKILQTETELSALQAQINPHFLFNILETFKMMAIIHDLDDFSDSIAALGNLMRYNIAPTGNRCTLEYELNIIRDYINIQNLLLNNRIILEISIPDNLHSFNMPNFILQPIIENSFAHGFENKLDSLLVKITICQEDTLVLIKIEDNGIGINEEQTKALYHAITMATNNVEMIPSGKSIGIVNVTLRLFLLYKDAYVFTISNSTLGGACITLALPINMPHKTPKEDTSHDTINC